MLSRLDTTDLDGGGDAYSDLAETAEDRIKYGRLVKLKTALRGFVVKSDTVALRRSIVGSYETDRLIEEFWNSTEGDWTQRPALYTAILDELEQRGFFNIRDVPPPPPAPRSEPTGRRPRRNNKTRR